MSKVAGRLKLELSQYRELEAFSQFGSELDPATQQTLARGERLVKTLNQPERHPMPVEDQVVQVYAATNGYLDRIVVEKVDRFLAELTESVRANNADLLEKIAGGDWSDETQAELSNRRSRSSPKTSGSTSTKRAIRSTTTLPSPRGTAGIVRGEVETVNGRNRRSRREPLSLESTDGEIAA